MTDAAVITETFPAVRADGRNSRSAESKRVILAACRRWMVLGNFRPSMHDICEAAGRSVRSGFQHYPGIEALHAEALQDEATRKAVLDRVLGDNCMMIGAPEEWFDRILRAIITGRAA